MNYLKTTILFLILIIASLSTKYYLDYQYFQKEKEKFISELNLLKQENLKKIQEINLLKKEKEKLIQENANLLQMLQSKEKESEEFKSQVNALLIQFVTQFSKYVNTDKEILKKYSKVYFLNENYSPLELSLLDSKYVYPKTKKIYLHSKVIPFLTAMLNTAYSEGINLKVISGYRSFEKQMRLKSKYTMVFGSGANKFVADQGYSEHQLGTTVDFTTEELGNNFDNFSKTKAYEWLLNNAYKFGFILSYPPGNKYYIFEPWHWRFVGIKLATKLHKEKKYFYDLDQREIDQYLITVFDWE